MQDALENNDFSHIPTADVPVAIPLIAQAAYEESSSEILIESLGFSIMGRNLDRVTDILDRMEQEDIDPASSHPFHLATSFHNGARSCCYVFATIAMYVTGAKVHDTYLNEHGHTILDNLMIAIIKSHTSAKPGVIDDELKGNARLIGKEVDVCGRWDADSVCVRQLHVDGHPSIPASWKHKFCHTSIQTICHCITWMFNAMPNPLLLDTPSGLYIRRCFDPECGKKLQLRPLHSLVVTAYHLATQGMDDEDLFGILACALCLVSCGFDPTIKADISVAALLASDRNVECDHEELSPAKLAEKIQNVPATQTWNAKLRTGWDVLVGVLGRCEAAHNDASEWSEGDIKGSTEPDGTLLYTHAHDDAILSFTTQHVEWAPC